MCDLRLANALPTASIDTHTHPHSHTHTAGHTPTSIAHSKLSLSLSLLSVCRGVVAFMSLQNIFILAIISLDTRMSVVGVGGYARELLHGT